MEFINFKNRETDSFLTSYSSNSLPQTKGEGEKMHCKKSLKQFNWLFFLSYSACAIGTTQIIPYLREMGIEGIQKGFILSGMAIFTLLSQFIFGYLSDRYRCIKKFFFVCFCLFIVVASGLYFFPLNVYGYLFLSVSFIGGISRTWQGLEDTWVLQSAEKENYSKIRAFGAVGWTLGCWIAALLLSYFEYKSLSVLLIFFSILSLFVTFKIQDSNQASGKIIKVQDLKKLFTNRAYLLLVSILFFLFALGCADMYIVIDKLLEIGGTRIHVGIKWGFQSLMEVPILLMGKHLLKKYQPVNLILFATVMFGIRFLIYSFIQDPILLILASSMQLVTFPIVIFSSKVLIDKITPSEVKASGQMMAMSIYMGLSLLIMPLFCSYLAKGLGYDHALLVVACLSIFPFVLLLFYKKLNKE